MGDSTRVMLPHPEIIAASEIDHVLLVDDGKVKLTVIGKSEDNDYLECRVDVPGKISNRKVSLYLLYTFLMKTSLLQPQTLLTLHILTHFL